MKRKELRIAQRQTETPRKPLNVEEDDEKNIKDKDEKNVKENNNVELIQSPAAMEPTRGSGNSTSFFSSIQEKRAPEAQIAVEFATEDAGWIRPMVQEMSKQEMLDRYEHDIDTIALSKVQNRKQDKDGSLAVEAALILQRYQRIPTFEEAKAIVIKAVNAALRQIKDSHTKPKQVEQVVIPDDDEEERPF